MSATRECEECEECMRCYSRRCDACEDRHCEMRDAGALAYALQRAGAPYIPPALWSDADRDSFDYGAECAESDDSLCDELVESWCRRATVAA